MSSRLSLYRPPCFPLHAHFKDTHPHIHTHTHHTHILIIHGTYLHLPPSPPQNSLSTQHSPTQVVLHSIIQQQLLPLLQPHIPPSDSHCPNLASLHSLLSLQPVQNILQRQLDFNGSSVTQRNACRLLCRAGGVDVQDVAGQEEAGSEEGEGDERLGRR